MLWRLDAPHFLLSVTGECMQLNRMSNRFMLALLTGLATVPVSAAQSDGWYMGSSIGYSKMKPSVQNYDISKYRYSEKNSDVGFKVFGGYQFNANWALEAQYIDLGKYQIEQAGSSVSRGSAKVKALALNVVGTIPVNEQFAVLGKLGVVQGKLDAEGSNVYGRDTYSATRTAPLVGIGAEYALTPQWILRGEYEFYGAPTVFSAGGSSVKFRSDMLSLGVRYRF